MRVEFDPDGAGLAARRVLLYRQQIGELPTEVVGVVGNHPREALNISSIGGIPNHHLPITRDTKPPQPRAGRPQVVPFALTRQPIPIVVFLRSTATRRAVKRLRATGDKSHGRA